MTTTSQLALSDRLLLLTLAVLVVATLAVGIKTHAFCSIFCVHGDRMVESDICSGRSAG